MAKKKETQEGNNSDEELRLPESDSVLEGELIDNEDDSLGDINHNTDNGQLVPEKYDTSKDTSRDMNKSLSLGEYSRSWSKMEWLLFTEIYHIAKKFFTGEGAANIQSYSQESLIIRVPVKMLNRNFFDPSNRSKQLRSAAQGLMSMQVRKDLNVGSGKQMGFDFITMFPRIRYDPSVDKDHLIVKIQADIYEDMIPIESIARFEVSVMEKLSAGNFIRIYSIIKSHAYKPRFIISFTELRKQMGFHAEGTYKDWGTFSTKILRPAVNAINKLKHLDIEVAYKKVSKKDAVRFEIKNFNKKLHKHASILTLNAKIDAKTRVPNAIQRKYIRSTLKNIGRHVQIDNEKEITEWIISDLIGMQRKNKQSFDFKRSMNGISKQISNKIYTQPFAHKHLISEAEGDSNIELVIFDEYTYNEIKRLEYKGLYSEIRTQFSDAELKAHRHEHLIEILDELEELGEL